jgi:formate hydrogenlyase transcriptional activator
MIPDRHFEENDDFRYYEALLQMADVIVLPRALPELLPALAERLQEVASFDVANFSLYEPDENVMRVHLWEDGELRLNLTELPLEQSVCGVAWEKQEPVVWPDLHQETRFEPAVRLLTDKGVRSYCALPLTSAQRRLGAIGLGSSRIGAYTERDVKWLSRAAALMSLALENAVTNADFLQEKQRQEALLNISTALVASHDLQKIFPDISAFIRKVFHHSFANLAIYDQIMHELRQYAWDFPLPNSSTSTVPEVSFHDSLAGRAFLEKEVKIYAREELEATRTIFVNWLLEQGIRSLCCLPLTSGRGVIGTLNLASKDERAFLIEDVSFLKQVAGQMAVALDNARAYREIAELTNKLKKEKLYLEDEIRSVHNFDEIIGDSAPLRQVLSLVQTVAPSDATVLILGETGTGKELAARAIHRLSSRVDASFIKLNCAAIPTGLMESELFGHEKGAFTGAVSQKVGRLELADRGTLFLDEVGEIPLELQPKLLRVLQDQEFERLGGNRTIKVDIRLIAATNRDLAKHVSNHEFRNDLYYRLHVFPLRMPPLRERSRDISLLVRYFVQKFAKRMNKRIETIPAQTMRALESWQWPGNIRELENFIERSVILSDGNLLAVPLAELTSLNGSSNHAASLEDLEREHILRVLRETGGVIAGVHGAATRLGMKRTTLQSRIQRLGILRSEYEN